MHIVPSLLGHLLMRLPDFPATWRRTYQKLEPQRRRALHGAHYGEPGDLDIDLGSRLLVMIGLRACEGAIGSAVEDPGRETIRRWFWVLFDAARRLWLTCHFDLNNARHDLVARFFSSMPLIFGTGVEEALERVLPTVSTTPSLLRLASWALWKNGIEPERAAQCFGRAGIDLRGVLRDAYDAEDVPVEVQEVSRALGVATEGRSDAHGLPAEQGNSAAVRDGLVRRSAPQQ
jgi:hypothetical protein